jgi:hypothetical protein
VAKAAGLFSFQGIPPTKAKAGRSRLLVVASIFVSRENRFPGLDPSFEFCGL